MGFVVAIIAVGGWITQGYLSSIKSAKAERDVLQAQDDQKEAEKKRDVAVADAKAADEKARQIIDVANKKVADAKAKEQSSWEESQRLQQAVSQLLMQQADLWQSGNILPGDGIPIKLHAVGPLEGIRNDGGGKVSIHRINKHDLPDFQQFWDVRSNPPGARVQFAPGREFLWMGSPTTDPKIVEQELDREREPRLSKNVTPLKMVVRNMGGYVLFRWPDGRQVVSQVDDSSMNETLPPLPIPTTEPSAKPAMLPAK